MAQRRTKSEHGGLTCRVVDVTSHDREPDFAVVLCHGYGAPGMDLVPMADEVGSRLAEADVSVRFVFPEAPLDLGPVGIPGGRAWWHLDISRIATAVEQGELRDLRNDLPEGLQESREKLMTALEDLRKQSGIPYSRMWLGGFSQGSMLATDVALRLPETPAGLCVMSGTLLCEQEWRALAEKRTDLPVLQSHGRQDPLLPFDAALWLRDMLTECGLTVDFVAFDGPHTIPYAAITALAEMIKRVV